MSFELSNVDLRLSRGLSNLKEHWVGVMESRARRTPVVLEGKNRRVGGGGGNYLRSLSQGNSRKSFSANYFSVESLLVLFCLAASLLILPLILPPLPPPPLMLLLLPIGILAVLMILAFMPFDTRNITSTYV